MLEKLVTRAHAVCLGAKVLTEAGVIRPMSPIRLAKVGLAVARWGTGPAGGFASLAARWPDRVGLVDELGSLTFGEMHRRSNALARALAERDIGEGDSIALMCRNHRYFVDATVAAAKLGADILYLNTAFAGPQLVEVLEREAPGVVVHDEEFSSMLAKADVERRVLAWTDGDDSDDGDGARDADTVESLVAAGDDSDLTPPERHSRVVILTSGTTGTPKGAPATRRASRPPSPCSSGSRCEPAPGCTSRRRCSTPGASRTSRSACCSARPRSCDASSTRSRPWS